MRMNRTRLRIAILAAASAAMLAAALTPTTPARGAAAAAETPRGRLVGGRAYELPEWFKTSFLTIADDAREAGALDRHAVLFMHLADCPYCARTLDENFRAGETSEFLRRHFDVVGIDIRGSRQVEWIDGRSYTEKELARALKVFGTPTIVFLDTRGNTVLRLNGYRRPLPFRQALEFVHGRHYQAQTLAAFVEKHKREPAYRLRPHPRFVDITNFAGHPGPLAVIFEDEGCADCDEFHDTVFTHPDVAPQLDRFTVVRLDAQSATPIIDTDGRSTTPREWAQRLGMDYRPGIVLFDGGTERARVDGMLYRFHFKELLRYVSGRHYVKHPLLSQYNAARREELLKQGVVIDYSQ
jgi:thioredoxin-related protein